MDFVKEYLAVDDASPTGLIWIAKPNTGRGGYVTIGAPALTACDNKGYFKGTCRKVPLYAHVVVFYLTHGYRPPVVDHIDGDTQNNRVSNLRASNTTQNAHNMISRGYDKHSCGKWRARICVDGNNKHLGLFETESAAREAYLAAKEQLHPTAPTRCFTL